VFFYGMAVETDSPSIDSFAKVFFSFFFYCILYFATLGWKKFPQPSKKSIESRYLLFPNIFTSFWVNKYFYALFREINRVR